MKLRNYRQKDLYPIDQMENKIVNLIASIYEDFGNEEMVSDAIFEMYAKAEVKASPEEKEKFQKILGFFRCMTDMVKEDSETFQDLQLERKTHNDGILPKQT